MKYGQQTHQLDCEQPEERKKESILHLLTSFLSNTMMIFLKEQGVSFKSLSAFAQQRSE